MMMKNKHRVLIVCSLVLAIALLVTACSSDDRQVFEYNGNTYEFPSYVFNQQFPNAPEAYAYAVEARDILAYFPCYCGCGVEPFNHEHNLACFIDEDKSTADNIVFDDHGAT